MKSSLKKMLIIIVSTIIISSTSVLAIYKASTIGTNSLSFILKLSTTNILQEDFTVNPPVTVAGMIPVVWDTTQSKWKVTTVSDTNWYNYTDTNADGTISSTEKKWANVMMPDTTAASYADGDYIDEADLGSMFVWIPRYEYKITYYTDATKVTESATQTNYGSIDVKFIQDRLTTADTGYTIHPAFRNGTSSTFANGEWDTEVTGIWVAKFETSYSSSGAVQSKPNVTNNTSKWTSTMYDEGKNATFSLTTANATLANSHMMKNSEWGAVAYLSYSKYGIDGGNVYVNNYFLNKNTTITGYYASTYNSSGTSSGVYADLTNMNKYDTAVGQNGSTTANIYGVYDMNGGRTEYVAAYMTGTTGTTDFITEGDTKYCSKYTVPSSGTTEQKIKSGSKTGDAMGETYFFNYNAVGKANKGSTYQVDTPTTLSSSTPCIARGGAMNNGYQGGGIMSFWVLANNSTSLYRGYRVTLIVD